MPVEAETVNGNAGQDQKSDVPNGAEFQTNGQPVETQADPEQVDVCALKAKVASDTDTTESATACPLITSDNSQPEQQPLSEPSENASADSQNGKVVQEPAIEQQQSEGTVVVEAEPQPVENTVPTPEPSPEPELRVEEPTAQAEPEPVAVTPTQPEVEQLVDIQPRIVEEPSAPQHLEIVSLIVEQPPTPEPEVPLSNGQSIVEVAELHTTEVEIESFDKPKILNGTIANELKTEDYKLPEVVEVKKHFEHAERVAQNDAPQPPRKGALATHLDPESIKKSYEDVRRDGSDTQWAVYKYEGPKLATSATGTDFSQFRNQFGDEDRAFGYIRVQTGDEMSKRAKFLLITWVGPSVSVLKRAKMSTDKALIKGIVSNFAVELQTENEADINLENFENELAKAGGAHYGTGVRG